MRFRIEEVPSTLPERAAPSVQLTKEQRLRRKVEDLLVGAGYAEAYTWTLVPRRRGQAGVADPMTADQAVLRTTLLPGSSSGSGAARRGAEWIALFEVARVTASGSSCRGAVARHGIAQGGFWGRRARSRRSRRGTRGASVRTRSRAGPLLHPGKAARTPTGAVGELHPAFSTGSGACSSSIWRRSPRRRGAGRVRGVITSDARGALHDRDGSAADRPPARPARVGRAEPECRRRADRPVRDRARLPVDGGGVAGGALARRRDRRGRLLPREGGGRGAPPGARRPARVGRARDRPRRPDAVRPHRRAARRLGVLRARPRDAPRPGAGRDRLRGRDHVPAAQAGPGLRRRGGSRLRASWSQRRTRPPARSFASCGSSTSTAASRSARGRSRSRWRRRSSRQSARSPTRTRRSCASGSSPRSPSSSAPSSRA